MPAPGKPVQCDLRTAATGKVQLDQIQIIRSGRVGGFWHSGTDLQRLFAEKVATQIKYMYTKLLAGALGVVSAPASLRFFVYVKALLGVNKKQIAKAGAANFILCRLIYIHETEFIINNDPALLFFRQGDQLMRFIQCRGKRFFAKDMTAVL